MCGVWGGGRRRSKAERGDGRETPHTHGTRWPERQQHAELSGVPPRPRDPPVGGDVCPGGPQVRGGEAAAAEARLAARRGRVQRQRRPERPGPRRRKRRCGSGRGGSPGPWLLDQAPAEARRGKWMQATSRYRQPRLDPVSGSPAPFIVLCPWEENQNVLERASRRGGGPGLAGRLSNNPPASQAGSQAGSAAGPGAQGRGTRGPRRGPCGGRGAASLPGPAPPGKGRRRVTAGGSPKGTARGEPFLVLVSYCGYLG